MPILLLLLILALLLGCKEDNTFKDERDGKKYKMVKIGEQVWMAENLNYNAENSKCYKDDPENCKKYGRLYDWQTAMKACPKGWHLPDTTEWNILVDFAGGRDVAGKKLKTENGWNMSGEGENTCGFSALPGGGYTSYGGFIRVGDNGYWWSASESSASHVYSLHMGYYYENTDWCKDSKNGLQSIRCVRD